MAGRGNSKVDLEADGYDGSPVLIGPRRSQLFKACRQYYQKGFTPQVRIAGKPINYYLAAFSS